MDTSQLEQIIDAAWDDRDNVTLNTKGEIREVCRDGSEPSRQR